jgi:hypothetical protein
MFLLDYSRWHVKSRLIVKEIITAKEIACLYQNLAKCLHANQGKTAEEKPMSTVWHFY